MKHRNLLAHTIQVLHQVQTIDMENTHGTRSPSSVKRKKEQQSDDTLPTYQADGGCSSCSNHSHDHHHLPPTGCLDDEDNVTPHRRDFLQNFRRLLFFWQEYYCSRGRDRLSLEFSSHIQFHEWNEVVQLLCADDDSLTSLVHDSIPLPRSPYTLPPRQPRFSMVRRPVNNRGV